VTQLGGLRTFAPDFCAALPPAPLAIREITLGGVCGPLNLTHATR